MKPHAILISLALLAGCATSPDYDAHFGDAVRDARQQMTLYPHSAPTADPGMGMDGQAAWDAMQRYQASFQSPPPVINVINVGGVGRNSGTQ